MTTRGSIRILFTLGVLVGSLALLGCPKRPEVMQAAPAPAGPSGAMAPAPAPMPPPPAPAETQAAPPPPPPAVSVPVPAPLKDAFFDFDKSAIREDQKAALDEDMSWLKANGGVKITVEGHCDERGTAEYNLALGERRAKAVKDYLVASGISADRIATISYGKERPFVLGHDETAWKWNRRGHFTVQGQ